MTPDQMEIVQMTFEKVKPLGEKVTELFYAELFRLDPSLRSMFPEDMAEQGRKLLASLMFVVKNLRTPETILGPVQEMGRRHVDYGVKPKHYDTVGQALLTTLENGLSDDWTPEAKEAWVAAYTLLAGVMKQAAYGDAA